MPTGYRPYDPRAAARLRDERTVRDLTLRPDWMLRAVCRTKPREADRFFPERTGRAGAADAGQAKEVCGRCPVKAECLQFALDGQEAAGVWGGLTTPERLHLLADRRVIA